MSELHYKNTPVSIIKIDYDNGENIIIVSKNPVLAHMMIKRSIDKNYATPNFFQEYYAVENNIKEFTITTLVENLTFRTAEQQAEKLRKIHHSVRETPAHKAAGIRAMSLNKLLDAFKQKHIPLNKEDKNFLLMVINTYDKDPVSLQLLCNMVYKTSSFAEFRSWFNEIELTDDRDRHQFFNRGDD